MTRKKGLRSSRSQALDQEFPQPKDPLGSLPNTCVYTLLENFTVVELIGIRRVSRGWKDAVDWVLAGIMKKCRPELAEGSTDEEQATLEFRREIFRQEAWNYGRPTFVRRFTHAMQGFAMCGDYFCWIDNTCLNVQLVFNGSKTRRLPRVERYRLTLLLRANTLKVVAIKPQEVGSITDRPLLMIVYAAKRKEGLSARDKPILRRGLVTRPALFTSYPMSVAVICVKSGTVLWSTAHDKHLHPSTPGRQVTLNHTTLAYIAYIPPGPTLCVRDVLTGQMKATKLIPDDLRSLEPTSIQLHPRRDLVYTAFRGSVLFFSATTANCVGRLSVARVSPVNHPYRLGGPLRLRFSEHQPIHSPSGREKFFLYECDIRDDPPGYYCFEYEVPTDEDISNSEARILQNGDQGSGESSVFKVQKIQIYEHSAWATPEGPPELNPMLNQVAQTEVGLVRGKGCTRVRFHSYTGHCPLPASTYNIFLEPGKRYDGSIPVEFYPRSGRGVLVTKSKRAPGHVRRHNERADCILPNTPPIAPIALTERYMLTRLKYVYLFAYEPSW